MTEQDKLRFAKEYIEKLANGINPLNDALVSEDDIVNNVHISRCLYYVAEILRQNLEGPPKETPKQKIKKTPFCLTEEERSKFEYSDVPISVSEIVRRLNALVDKNKVQRIKYNDVLSWLIEVGMLKLVQIPEGKTVKHLTSRGSEFGLAVEQRTGMNGTYDVIVYSRNAQEFIVDNIEAVMGLAQHRKEQKKKQTTENKNKSMDDEKHPDNQFQPWTADQDEELIELFRDGAPAKEISDKMKRSETGIRARLKKLGMIENRKDAK